MTFGRQGARAISISLARADARYVQRSSVYDDDARDLAILDDFARDHAGEVLVTKLDTDRNPVTTQRLGIRAIPTLIVFRSGRETARHAGVTSRQQLDALVAPPARVT